MNYSQKCQHSQISIIIFLIFDNVLFLDQPRFFLNQTNVFCLSHIFTIFYFVLTRATCDTCAGGMLPKNFQVGCQILNNVTRNSLPILHFSKKVVGNSKFIKWPENKVRLTSEQYRKKLEQCPKPSFAQLCCKKLFSKPKPKVNRKLFNFTLFLIKFFLELFNESVQIG